MTADLTVIVIAKEPRPGRVKTRLHSMFSPHQAAQLAAAALADTFDAVVHAQVGRRVLALDGDPGDWVPAGFEVIRQVSGGLDLRLAGAFDQVFGVQSTDPESMDRESMDRESMDRESMDRESMDQESTGPVLLIGMDTPQVTSGLLTSNWLTSHWHGADAVLGLSEDGGFWAVGLRWSCPEAFAGVPMSTEHTGADQLARLESLGLRVHLLPTLRDVDTPDDAAAVAALLPDSKFGRLHERIVLERQLALEEQFRVVPAPLPPARHPLELYAAALAGERVRVLLADGDTMPLAVAKWLGRADSADRLLLNRCEGAVLDLGCGPGRLVGALAAVGRPALGIDICPDAVQLTAARGASVLRRTVQGPLPAEGRWGTVLLADGNLGIGGDPEALLRRCRQLLRPTGLLLVEADPIDQLDDRGRITLVDAAGIEAVPLPWARLGCSALATIAERTGFAVVEEWRVSNRVFLALRALDAGWSPAQR